MSKIGYDDESVKIIILEDLVWKRVMKWSLANREIMNI